MKKTYAHLLSSAFLSALLLLMLIGCTRTQNIEFDLSKSEVVNTTRLENRTSNLSERPMAAPETDNLVDLDNLAPDELTESYEGNLTRGLCTEKVLIGLRECHWINETLNITIKNPGFRNITMIFYVMSGSDEMTNVSSEHILAEKGEASYLLPMPYLAYQSRIPLTEIDKIYATPILSEEGRTTSCSNKNLPVILDGCKRS